MNDADVGDSDGRCCH